MREIMKRWYLYFEKLMALESLIDLVIDAIIRI